MAESSALMSQGARFLPTLKLDGRWQMAIDRWLLDQGRPSFRLYRWQRPTLSIGFHQRQWPSQWSVLAHAGVIELVRRPSGGRAVLHAGDLTYALVWPDAPANRQEAYRRCCAWLQQAFAALGLPLHFGDQAAGGSSSNCFASRTAADLVHEGGAKRVGSAQFWRQGRLLQHGSIQVNPPAELWQQLFGEAPPNLPTLPALELGRSGQALLASELLEDRLWQAARRALPAPFVQGRLEPLRDSEWEQISRQLAATDPELPLHQ